MNGFHSCNVFMVDKYRGRSMTDAAKSTEMLPEHQTGTRRRTTLWGRISSEASKPSRRCSTGERDGDKKNQRRGRKMFKVRPCRLQVRPRKAPSRNSCRKWAWIERRMHVVWDISVILQTYIICTSSGKEPRRNYGPSKHQNNIKIEENIRNINSDMKYDEWQCCSNAITYSRSSLNSLLIEATEILYNYYSDVWIKVLRIIGLI